MTGPRPRLPLVQLRATGRPITTRANRKGRSRYPKEVLIIYFINTISSMAPRIHCGRSKLWIQQCAVPWGFSDGTDDRPGGGRLEQYSCYPTRRRLIPVTPARGNVGASSAATPQLEFAASPGMTPASDAGAIPDRAAHFGSRVSGTSVMESTGIAFALAACRMAASSGAS